MPDKIKKKVREIVTIGLPLPNLLEYTADVSPETRECLNEMKHYSESVGIATHEIKARSINTASNHSNLVKDMIGDWILIVGSDHTFAPNTLELLLKATQEPPNPKILGAVCNYRVFPYRWTAALADEYGERYFTLLPWYNCDPNVMGAGSIQEVDVIGSGVTLYHRSVFDKIPPPHFTYEARRPGMPEIEDVLRDWDGELRFDEWLEKISEGPDFLQITEADAVRLKEKGKGLRRLLAKFRRPSALGMDYHICAKAKEYGIKSYIHWGVITHHLTLEHTHPQRYVHVTESDRKFWRQEAISRKELTFESVRELRNMEEEAQRKRKEWEEAVANMREQRIEELKDEDRESAERVGGEGLEGEHGTGVHVEREGVEVPEEQGAY